MTEQPDPHTFDHSHADVSGGWLRAATFGAMDGLVTNTALIAGVGAAAEEPLRLPHPGALDAMPDNRIVIDSYSLHADASSIRSAHVSETPA